MANFKQSIPTHRGLCAYRVEAPTQAESLENPKEIGTEMITGVEEKVPTTMSNALRTFFVGGNSG
eukprot:CAMPEP_0185739612 /NCGR_PEP_ID=MMETSP1171-20130828/35834_1 /TAXON_ID=374046 /ORGANISM="Helicotheca tamensis, Strain CCMP826" /LENGTH=64 /DNA_ID=CAMNT_0028411229 /DNA_START=116 /DNA_END=306 /DNA_ORIENTATION=-